MKLNYFLMCDAAAIAQDGKLIIHGVFERMWAVREPSREQPAIHPSMALVFQVEDVERSQNLQGRIELTHVQTGEKIGVQQLTIGAEPGMDRFNVVTAMPMIPLPFLGDYLFTLYIQDEKIGETKFEFKLRG